MECMFTAQGSSVLHAIEVAVVQFAQVHLVYYCSKIYTSFTLTTAHYQLILLSLILRGYRDPIGGGVISSIYNYSLEVFSVSKARYDSYDSCTGQTPQSR